MEKLKLKHEMRFIACGGSEISAGVIERGGLKGSNEVALCIGDGGYLMDAEDLQRLKDLADTMILVLKNDF